MLPVRETLLASVSEALAGHDGAWLWIEGAAMARLDFLIPGRARTGAHVARYDGPHSTGPGARIVRLGLHLGTRDGARFLHGHGVFAAPGWSGPRAGHILPLESALAGTVRATGWGLQGARLAHRPDPETGFPLFAPQDCGGAGALLMTARPNQDLGAAVLDAAQDHGMTRARVHGLGSLVCPQLSDARRVDSLATEILVTEGALAAGKAQLCADIVGLDGRLHSGPLRAGANGICVTAELLLIEQAP